MANGTWRISRRSSSQLPLLISAILAVLLLLAGKLHFVPFERARTAITDRAAPILQKMNAPVLAMTRWVAGVGHFFDVYSENLRLKEENARLLQWRGAALALQGRIKGYESLLKAVPDSSYSAVTAKVIARSSQPFLETIVLNTGRRDGVQPGQAVVDARGVLGRVYVAGDHTAWVILVDDLNSRIPVLIRPGNVQAILTGNNTSEPVLDALPQNTKLKNGAEIVTSGDGGLLPAGLPIGLLQVSGREIKVQLYADPLAAEEVRVLDYKSPIEPMPKPADKDLPGPVTPPAPPPPPEVQKPVPNPATASAGEAAAQSAHSVHGAGAPAAVHIIRPPRQTPETNAQANPNDQTDQ
jgi:rod shape-determining protein MreC